jgi:hypothetical protein
LRQRRRECEAPAEQEAKMDFPSAISSVQRKAIALSNEHPLEGVSLTPLQAI